MSDLITDFSAGCRATFSPTEFGTDPGKSFSQIVQMSPGLPNHPLPKMISSSAVDSKLWLLDTPATLYPDEHWINNV
ncbi:MAG TPA: hypothetical protein VEI58_06200 [Chthoniobacterales bacterium]|nr:hypothetical protein [Chthoniobacterales bacterium]